MVDRRADLLPKGYVRNKADFNFFGLVVLRTKGKDADNSIRTVA